MGKKGFMHIDYIIAIGVFIFIFGFAVFYVTDYLTQMRESGKSIDATANAASLLLMTDFSGSPAGWPGLEKTTSLQLVFRFDANASANGTVKDSGYYGNNGIAHNSSFNTSGKFGGGWSFESGDIQMPGSGINLTNAVTLEAWIFMNANESRVNSIFSRGSGNLELQVGGVNGVRCIPANGVYLDTGSSILPWQWTHVACVYNPLAGIAKIYVNGSDAGAVNDGPNPVSTPLAIDSSTLFMGMRFDGTMHFNGSLDEAAVYNVSFSSAEMAGHAQPEKRLERIGLMSKIYRLDVLVNNSKFFWHNQSLNQTALTNEIVSIDIAELSSGYVMNSVSVKDGFGDSVPYQQSGDNISFVVPSLPVNSTAWYSVYVSDEGIFPGSPAIIAGSDVISESMMPPQEIAVVGSTKMRNLGERNYTAIREAMNMGSFRIRLYDIASDTNYFVFGDSIPRRGNIVALQKYVLFQNSTAELRQGRLTVQAW